MCLFHKWSKWEQYEHHYQFSPGIIAPKELRGRTYSGVDLRQRRACLKCGSMQDELVSEGVWLANKRLQSDASPQGASK